jgi:HK97 gp10 family phage protein
MSDIVTFEIKGLDELQKQLEALPHDVMRQVLNKDLKEVGNMCRDEIIMLAPKDTGFMDEHFAVDVKISKVDVAGTVKIGAAKGADYPDTGVGAGYHQRFSNSGKRKLAGRISVASVVRFFEFGTSKLSKKPFLTSAFESKKDAMLQKIISGIRESLAKVSSK